MLPWSDDDPELELEFLEPTPHEIDDSVYFTVPAPPEVVSRLGLCRTYPTRLWFDADEDSRPVIIRKREAHRSVVDKVRYHGHTTARRICAACPVQEKCLAYAMAHPEVVGIWGGRTTYERRMMREHGVSSHEELLVLQLRDEGRTVNEIARKVGRHSDFVTDVLKRHGRSVVFKKFTPELVAEIVRLRDEEGLSWAQITTAIDADVSPAGVRFAYSKVAA